MHANSCDDTMDSTKWSVFWADHHRSQATVFRNFLDNNSLVDCTIAAEGNYLKAHKLVLSACSSYFQMLFTQENEKNPIVVLKDIKYEELKAIIEFVYCGEVKIPEDRLSAFLDAAQTLQIIELDCIPKNNENANSTVHDTSGACNREENSTTSDEHLQCNNSNDCKESASEFVQTTCASNFSSDNPLQVQLCQLESTYSLASMSSLTSPTKERAHVLGSHCDETNISTLPAAVIDISQSNFHSSEDFPSRTDPFIEMDPNEAMFPEPNTEDIRDTLVGNTSLINDANEMEVDLAPAPYEETQYSDTYIEMEESEPVLELEAEHINETSFRNMSVMNEMEKDKESVSYEENQYPDAPTTPQDEDANSIRQDDSAAVSDSSPGPDIARDKATQTYPRRQRNSQQHERAQDESACSKDAPETPEDVPAASRFHRKGSPAVVSPCPDNNDIANGKATKRRTRQRNCQLRKRPQDKSARPRGANNMSYSLRGQEEKSQACRESCHTVSTLHKHVRLQHSAGRPYQCDRCSAVFRFPSLLKIHMRKHTNERPYRCKVCSSAFKDNFGLKSHMRKHTGERPYRCKVCSATFTVNGTLTKHMRKHTGERPYQCKVCNAAFTQSSGLYKHMRRHTGERPYRCEVCSAAFRESGTLTKHMRKHTGEKPYQCKVCSVTFSQNGSLTKHMRQHTGEKPYICADCGKRFVQRETLVLHIRSHTGERPYVCRECGKRFTQKSKLVKHSHAHGRTSTSAARAEITSE